MHRTSNDIIIQKSLTIIAHVRL